MAAGLAPHKIIMNAIGHGLVDTAMRSRCSFRTILP